MTNFDPNTLVTCLSEIGIDCTRPEALREIGSHPGLPWQDALVNLARTGRLSGVVLQGPTDAPGALWHAHAQAKLQAVGMGRTRAQAFLANLSAASAPRERSK